MPRRHTILVVDDEPDVVQSLQDLLRLDYKVMGATRAVEGLRIMESVEVHVVMSDQRMPEITGVEFLRRVRDKHPDTIRLLITGYADIKAVIDAINQGSVYRYITKPWDPDELQTIIRQAAEQRDLLEERKRLLAELTNKNNELGEANIELKQANQLKEAFIRVASHELRTPLTIIAGLTELALQTPDCMTEGVKRWLISSLKACERLDRLVDQLTKMLTAGNFARSLDRRPTDLPELIRQAAQEVKPFVDQRKQELTLDLAPDLGTIDVEMEKIRDSLENLLLNAIKFTPDGGKILLCARKTENGWVEIRVCDSGVGIDAAHRPHLFKTFFTGLDVSRHSSGRFEFNRRGLGLGLSLVKAFVEMHGGKIDVASEPGKGSTFTITLPGPAV
ncbi:MAG TPA: hybrid sensor histidine kinase/response regulator [Gemmataceae bacterium]|nr:hybrid sensor histidine kinase/response regulator [Gemmataceae bacterium]